MADIRTRGPSASDDLVARWRALLRHWFLGQLAAGQLPLDQRDVYELSVPRWLDLFQRAQLNVTDHRFVGATRLFHRYVFTGPTPASDQS